MSFDFFLFPLFLFFLFFFPRFLRSNDRRRCVAHNKKRFATNGKEALTFSQTTPMRYFARSSFRAKISLDRSTVVPRTKHAGVIAIRYAIPPTYCAICICYPTISLVETRFLGSDLDRPRDAGCFSAKNKRTSRTGVSFESHPLASSFPLFQKRRATSERDTLRMPMFWTRTRKSTYLTAWRWQLELRTITSDRIVYDNSSSFLLKTRPVRHRWIEITEK